MKGIFVIILLIYSLSVYGQTEKRQLWKIQLEGALDNYSRWEVEPSVTFQPFKYAGIGVSFIFSESLDGIHLNGVSADKKFRFELNDEKVLSTHLACRIAPQFYTPSWILGHDQEYALYLTFSPGITCSFPPPKHITLAYFPNSTGVWTPHHYEEVTTSRAEPLSFQLKTSVSLEMEESLIISLGYTLSNLDPYSGVRETVFDGNMLNLGKKRPFFHSLSIGIGWRF